MNSYYCPRFAVRLRTPSSFLFYFPIFLATTFLIVLGGPSSAATPTSLQPNTPQLIIPPFDIQTATPHPYLQTGLANILATRVSKKTGHIIAPHSTASDKLINLLRQQDNTTAVQKILQEKGKTYLLAGTLKEKDEGYEIAIQVFSYQSSSHTNFSQTFNQLDNALSALDELSLDIAEKTFSIPRPPEQPEVEPSNNGIEGFQTAHPERFFKEKKYGDTGNSLNNLQPEIKKSAFDGGIQSSRKDLLPSPTALAMTVGDLNNDGKNEFVILERNNLALYHRTGNSSFQRIAFQPIARHLGLHTVFLADLDHNGLQEIYIA
ncbi:MAG: hypothetical protein D3910_09680, partial [Candidatus Electrothrix sp. ATG2]|nr:hypothetical protein [Candidatus Electrothrix sp. ATG2]